MKFFKKENLFLTKPQGYNLSISASSCSVDSIVCSLRRKEHNRISLTLEDIRKFIESLLIRTTRVQFYH